MCCGGKRLIPGKWVLVLTGTQESHSVTRVAPNKTLTRRVQGPRSQECRCAEWRSVLLHPLLWLVSSPGREKQGLCLSRGPVSAACMAGSGGGGEDVHLGWGDTTLPVGSLFQIHRIPGAQPGTLWLPISKLHTHRSCF